MRTARGVPPMATNDEGRTEAPVDQITTTDPKVVASEPEVRDLYPPRPGVPANGAASPTAVHEEVTRPNEPVGADGAAGGILGEKDVWEARYSLKNFLGRFLVRILLTVAATALAIYVWGYLRRPSRGMEYLAIGGWIVVGLFWLHFAWQVARARLSHYYRLTTRRLFIASGVFHRRVDQVELVKVDDVYIRQATVLHRWLDIGTVVVESKEERYPISYLTGVDDPQGVMDIVWHHARCERDGKTVMVDEV